MTLLRSAPIPSALLLSACPAHAAAELLHPGGGALLLFLGMTGLFVAGSFMRPGVTVGSRRQRSRRSSVAPALAMLMALGIATAAEATPLFAGGDHTGEDHSNEKHDKETLNGIILSSAYLEKIDLSESILADAIAIGADFTKAKLEKTDFTNASLTGSVLLDAKAKEAIFDGANLDGLTLSGANVDKASFVGASLLGADLSNLKKADKADWTGARYDASTILDPDIDTSSMVFVSEPTVLSLIATGLLGVLARRRRSLARGHATG